MSFLIFILVMILAWWALKTGLRLWLNWKVNSARRHFEEMFRGNADPSQRPQEPAPQRPARRKKIDPEVGEYVVFEEISVTTEQSQTPPSPSAAPESQIEDAEWEDLPSKP